MPAISTTGRRKFSERKRTDEAGSFWKALKQHRGNHKAGQILTCADDSNGQRRDFKTFTGNRRTQGVSNGEQRRSQEAYRPSSRHYSCFREPNKNEQRCHVTVRRRIKQCDINRFGNHSKSASVTDRQEKYIDIWS